MRNADQLLVAALKTHDPIQLYKLIEESIDCIRFTESKLGFSEAREKKLAEQVQRQTKMIENLEKTLWTKK